jgi:hypothetical protein
MLLLIGAVISGVLGCGLLACGIGNDRFYDEFNRSLAPANASAEERTLRTFERVSAWNYFDASRIHSRPARWLAELEHASPLHVSARTTLTAGADRIGPCGSLTRSMIVLLRRAGIPARKAILYSQGGAVHTVVEVWLDGEWRVFDPTYAWTWRRPHDGAIATVADLAADAELFATVRSRHVNYPLEVYTYRDVHHLRWEKVPGLHLLRRVLVHTVGAEKVRAIGTPHVYERPIYFVGWVLVIMALAHLASWVVLRRAAGRVATARV